MSRSFKPLKDRSVVSIIRALGGLSERWLDPRSFFRRQAVDRLVRGSGFTEKMAHETLNATFKELTARKLSSLLRLEVGDPLYLDGFHRNKMTRQLLRCHGPENILHIFSSNIPNPAIWSVVMGLLIKSRNYLKISGRDQGVLDIYMRSLKKADPQLARYTIRLPMAHSAIHPYLKVVDLVVCYGDEATIGRVRSILPAKTAFVGYGHRVSLAVVLKEAMTPKNVLRVAQRTALDAWMVDGRGCLSPNEVFIEKGGSVEPGVFEQIFRRELGKLYHNKPAGYHEASLKKVRALKTRLTRFRTLDEVYGRLKRIQPYLQAVALEGEGDRRIKVAERLSAMGVNRICRAGQMQYPPITWHHDGQMNLSGWLRWTDLE